MSTKDKTIQEIAKDIREEVQNFKPAPLLRGVAKAIQIIASVVYGLTTASFIGVVWWVIAKNDLPLGQHTALSDIQCILLATLGYIAVGSPLVLLERAFDRISEGAEQSRRSTIIEAVIAGTWLASLLLAGILYLFLHKN